VTLKTDKDATARRSANVEAVLAELTAWSPRERMGMFRRWLAGSLSIIHLHVLTILEASGPLSMGKVAEALDVSVASATGIVDRMEQRGLIERHAQPGDRRIVIVQPTPAGLAVFSDLDAQRRITITRILERLTDDELSSFLIGLRAMGVARVAITAEAAQADESATNDPTKIAAQ
jgi:DNA-binding MarR family transcriptional regulator